MTYATEAELIAYAAARGVTITALEAPILLTKAGDWLQVQPITVPDPVPDQIKQAQMVCAMIYHAGGDPLAAITPRVTQETVFGAVSVSYSDSGLPCHSVRSLPTCCRCRLAMPRLAQ